MYFLNLFLTYEVDVIIFILQKTVAWNWMPHDNILDKWDIIKNYNDILPYLKANKLSCHSFMNAGRRHEISVQIQKTLW